ncbi:hypothetical protein [Tumebacillus flagellatus]|uniref:Uncharacterized protein n=1 Tax=Tumebacillus flagellatus TaxID=1157490 RepID=A0A074M627_9BACL|nr:hypothetical protein [Tumebacillus flagellatus]KEO81467.1 hypothetical protein EL26_20540 [Tumebacillus flagellatus]
MPKITKRSVWGYTPDSVDLIISELQTAHREQMDALQQEHTALTEANDRLRLEIQHLQEIQQNAVDEQVMTLFWQAHLEQTREVYQMLEELKLSEQKQIEVLEVSQLHRESVVQQALEKLKQLEINLQVQVKEGEHGGPSAT